VSTLLSSASPSPPLLNAAGAGSVIVPRCPTCGAYETVAPVHVEEVDRGVNYWSCTRCALAWGTRDFSGPRV